MSKSEVILYVRRFSGCGGGEAVSGIASVARAELFNRVAELEWCDSDVVVAMFHLAASGAGLVGWAGLAALQRVVTWRDSAGGGEHKGARARDACDWCKGERGAYVGQLEGAFGDMFLLVWYVLLFGARWEERLTEIWGDGAAM